MHFSFIINHVRKQTDHGLKKPILQERDRIECFSLLIEERQ